MSEGKTYLAYNVEESTGDVFCARCGWKGGIKHLEGRPVNAIPMPVDKLLYILTLLLVDHFETYHPTMDWATQDCSVIDQNEVVRQIGGML